MCSLPPYAFLAQDFTTQAALYTHHQYIAGFIMTGAFAHGAIFFIRDYNPEQNKDNVLAFGHLFQNPFLFMHNKVMKIREKLLDVGIYQARGDTGFCPLSLTQSLSTLV
ncbi:hypothetical protein Mapa_003141 [Marchantia paleacea]|nr:hypothetical protein Mapa_003141 [Marchantia paleacea]